MRSIWHEVVATSKRRQTAEVVSQELETTVVLTTSVAEASVTAATGHVITAQ